MSNTFHYGDITYTEKEMSDIIPERVYSLLGKATPEELRTSENTISI